jgi:dienelactone hydrolase
LYYPATSWLSTSEAVLRNVVGGIKIPTLFFVGGADTYSMNCCTLDTARRIEAVAKELAAPLELVVYPQAGHGFNIAGGGEIYRADDAADAFKRTLAHINRHRRD